MKAAIIIVILALLWLPAVIVLACCKVSGDCSRAEEEDPCGTCLRWSECNGVDENCPWRAEDGK